MRILAADDSENARDILRATLESDGFTDVTFTASGQEALDAVRAAGQQGRAFDIILLDVVMPDMDGIEACAQMRGMAHHASVPILMITSLADMETLAQAFVAGANDYVTKPFQRTELLARVRNAFRFKGELDRRHAREAELLELTHRLNRNANGVENFVDAATSTLNREALEAALRQLPRGAGFTPGLLALQIDNLKGYRERYGAAGAATLLTGIAEGLKRTPGHLGDLLSYFGGGLFIALLHLDSPDAARAAAGAAQAQVLQLKLLNGAEISVSAGIAVLRAGDSREPRALLADAISAVERAMAQGGDRLVVADPPTLLA